MKKLDILVSFILLFMTACAAAPVGAPAPTFTAAAQPNIAPTSQPIPTANPTAAIDASPVEFVWLITGEPNAFIRPTGVATDGQSNIYVVDGGNHRIQKFDSDGKFLTMWGNQGSGDGQFVFLVPPAHYGSVAVDSQGNVYVTDHNARVQKFDSSGKFLMKWGQKGTGDGQFADEMKITVDIQGNAYVTDVDNYRIQKFDSNGKFLLKWGQKGTGDGEFGNNNASDWGPFAIAVDREGNVYVTDPGNYRVQKFDSNGRFLNKWGSQGTGDNQFARIGGIATDQKGRVYVTDLNAQRVLQFDNQGKFLSKWGSIGTTPGMLLFPSGIAADNQSNIYVVSVTAGNVQKFRLR